MTPSEKIFARLLRLYPAAFREEFGESMLQHFRDLQQEALNSKRSLNQARFWVHVVIDTFCAAFRQRLLSLGHKQSTVSRTMRRSPSFPFLFLLFLIPLIAGLLAYVRAQPREFLGRVFLNVSPVKGRPALPGFVESQMVILISDGVLREVVQTTGLAEYFSNEYKIKGVFHDYEAVEMLRSRLGINIHHPGVNMVLGVRLPHSAMAANVANSIADRYQRNAVATADVDILDRAVANSRAVRPNVPAMIVLGSLLCVFLSAVAAGLLRLLVRNGPSNLAPAS